MKICLTRFLHIELCLTEEKAKISTFSHPQN